MIVVIDTNIWFENLYLRTPAGVATRFYLLQNDAKVGLPEVVRLEVQAHLRETLLKNVESIYARFERLLAIFGTLKKIVLPSESEIDAKVATAFDSLGVDLIEVPFSLESARSSFSKVIRKLPPSKTNQQFKDGVLWADCLRLLKDDDVILVTGDRAFYEERDFEKGLAKSLVAELRDAKGEFKILCRLPDLLKEIQADVVINEDALVSAFVSGAVRERYTSMAERNGFRLGDPIGLDYELFLTEKPEVLFLEFAIILRCPDVNDIDRKDATLHVKGDGFYNVKTKEFSDLGELEDTFEFQDQDGEEKKVSGVTIRANALFLGHADQHHTLRQKLEPPS